MSIKDANGDDITNTGNFAIVNPFRYRGYYYDTESGLYYLQSRYYDSTTGRFVNADSFEYLGASEDIIGYNLFAYCENNPVVKIDSDGSFGIITWVVIGTVVGVTVGAVGGAHYAKHKMNLSPNDGWNYWKYVVGFGSVGGIIGEFCGLGLGCLFGTGSSGIYFNAISKALSGISNKTWSHIITNKHAWNLVMKNVTRDGVKKIISMVMRNGVLYFKYSRQRH